MSCIRLATLTTHGVHLDEAILTNSTRSHRKMTWCTGICQVYLMPVLSAFFRSSSERARSTYLGSTRRSGPSQMTRQCLNLHLHRAAWLNTIPRVYGIFWWTTSSTAGRVELLNWSGDLFVAEHRPSSWRSARRGIAFHVHQRYAGGMDDDRCPRSKVLGAGAGAVCILPFRFASDRGRSSIGVHVPRQRLELREIAVA
jgi:hypothetical protein